MKTNVYRELDTAKDNVRYDEYVKRVLSNKYILAWILKSTTEEFKNYSIETIAMKCIEKDIQIGEIPVYPGATNTRVPPSGGIQKDNESIHQKPHMITGDLTESRIPGEGTVTYDIRFRATVPGEKDSILLIIDIEAQQSFYTKYEMITRGIFYAARMISAQLDTEFTNSDYNKLKKVYSIFICMNAPKYIGNTICEYKITKHDLIGSMPDKKYSYDKMSVIMVCLNETMDKSSDGLLHLLNVLLSIDMQPDRKAAILNNIYDITVDDSLEKELNVMCNLSEAIEKRGEERGEKRGEQRMSALIKQLLIDGRMEDIRKVTENTTYREALYKKYSL